MAVIALIALVIIGPKDLPKVMRTAAQWARKARGLAREFQSGVDDMIREADLEDARKVVESARSLDVRKAIGDTVDPTGDLRDEARDLERSTRDTDGDETRDGDGKDEAVAADTGAEPNIAPPHSLTPPQKPSETPPSPEPPNPEPSSLEPASLEPPSQPAADDSAGKRAS